MKNWGFFKVCNMLDTWGKGVLIPEGKDDNKVRSRKGIEEGKFLIYNDSLNDAIEVLLLDEEENIVVFMKPKKELRNIKKR